MDSTLKPLDLSNAPNPWHRMTTVSITLAHPETISLQLFNPQGQLVRGLKTREFLNAGTHLMTLESSPDFKSGCEENQKITPTQTATTRILSIRRPNVRTADRCGSMVR